MRIFLASERGLWDGVDIRCEGHIHKKRVVYMRDIHHIDGNPRNNKPENLKLLCQNCHRTEDKIMRRVKRCEAIIPPTPLYCAVAF